MVSKEAPEYGYEFANLHTQGILRTPDFFFHSFYC